MQQVRLGGPRRLLGPLPLVWEEATKMIMGLESRTLLLDEDMDEARFMPFAGGCAGFVSTRAPDKETPNEDGAAVIPIDEASGLLIITDGAGGGPSGERASRVTLETIVDAAHSTDPTTRELRECILGAIDRANSGIQDLGVGAGTTLVIAEVRDRVVRSYHVGDSHLLIVGQRGKIKRFTVAHSPTGYAVEAGYMDEKEALGHEDRHLVSNLVGFDDMRIELGPEVRLRPRDTVILATDGLFDNLALEEIVGTMRSGPLDRCVAELRTKCLERMRSGQPPSKPDDLTVVAFRPAQRTIK